MCEGIVFIENCGEDDEDADSEDAAKDEFTVPW
jgi:hypothetical protein